MVNIFHFARFHLILFRFSRFHFVSIDFVSFRYISFRFYFVLHFTGTPKLWVKLQLLSQKIFLNLQNAINLFINVNLVVFSCKYLVCFQYQHTFLSIFMISISIVNFINFAFLKI